MKSFLFYSFNSSTWKHGACPIILVWVNGSSIDVCWGFIPPSLPVISAGLGFALQQSSLIWLTHLYQAQLQFHSSDSAMEICTSDDGARAKSLNYLKVPHWEALANWSALHTVHQQNNDQLNLAMSSISGSETGQARTSQAWPLQTLLVWKTISQTMAGLGNFLKDGPGHSIHFSSLQDFPTYLPGFIFHSVKVFVKSKHTLADAMLFAL